MEREVTNLSELEECLERCQSTADKFGLPVVAVRIGEALEALTPSIPHYRNGTAVS